MAALSAERIAELLEEFYPAPGEKLVGQLSVYLELLLKWNARTNLTAIRDTEEMVRRHFGESLFLATRLPACRTLLDLGSGAGFPGIPVQLARPGLIVTLAESQNKKAAFLREVVRTLCLPTEVWAGRVEDMAPERRFDVVAMRAVDHPARAMELARSRVAAAGVVAVLAGGSEDQAHAEPLPGADKSFLYFYKEFAD